MLEILYRVMPLMNSATGFRAHRMLEVVVKGITLILYYPDGNQGPVKEYLSELAKDRPKAFARLVLDLEILGAEGLRSRQITIRPLGDKLWELKRLYDGIQYRLFFGVGKGAIWLLHSIEKKSAKTPKDDLELSRKRLKEVINR